MFDQIAVAELCNTFLICRFADAGDQNGLEQQERDDQDCGGRIDRRSRTRIGLAMTSPSGCMTLSRPRAMALCLWSRRRRR